MVKLVKLFFAFAVGLLVSGCASKTISNKESDNKISIGSKSYLTLREPKDMLAEFQVIQILQIKYGEMNRSSQVILTSKDNSISVVGLMPFGGESFRIEYNQNGIRAKLPPGFSSKFNLTHALADIVLILADKSAIEELLSEDTKVVDSGLTRKIFWNDHAFIEIEYSSPTKLNSHVLFRHLERNYSLEISPVDKGISTGSGAGFGTDAGTGTGAASGTETGADQ